MSTAEEPAKRPNGPAPGQAERVLIVEDDPEFSRFFEIALGAGGYRVVTAAGLAAARGRLLEETFGALLVDLQLPDGEGVELLADARRRDPRAELVIATGHASLASALSALRSGAYDYLLKPCPAGTLLAVLGRAIEKRLLGRALDERNARLDEANRLLGLRVSAATAEILRLNEQLNYLLSEIRGEQQGLRRRLENSIHEIRNSLTLMQGHASLLARRRGPAGLDPARDASPEDSQGFSAIHDAGQVMEGLLEELRACALRPLSFLLPRKERFSAEEILLPILAAMRLQAELNGLTLLAYQDAGARTPVLADRRWLYQVLLNLLQNSMRYTPRGGRIRVGVQAQASSVLFAVENTGTGISPQERERIFARGYRGPGSAVPGEGLGLAIVLELVCGMGGRIWVESEPGEGARFCFTLPNAVAEGNPPQPPPSSN